MGGRGIYIASKTKHASKWKALRSSGLPIISTWIDEAGVGETTDFRSLWGRCIVESKSCKVMIVYSEKGDVLKGAWLEMGVALSCGIPVLAVGFDDYTIAKSGLIVLLDQIDDAVTIAKNILKS